MVTEIISGSRTPFSSKTFSMATIAALASERVEDRLEQEHVDAAVDQAAHLSSYAARISSKVMARNAGLLTSGEIDSVAVRRTDRAGDEARPVRRLRRPLVGGRARQPRPLDVHARRPRLERVVRLRDRGAAEGVRFDDVGAGREVLVMDGADDVGPREDEDVAVALQVARMIGEALAAEVRFGQLVALDHRPHRAVEDEDAALEQASGA